jgi:alginate O-acetyltransferase complex protein AlgI
MSFTEYSFILILALLVPATFLMRRFPTAQKTFLLAFSLLFFATFGLSGLWLYLIIAFLNYWLTLAIAKARSDTAKRVLLGLTVTVDLGALALFKYADFIGTQIFRLPFVAVVDALPWDPLWRPIALSFYVFHMISYAVDIRSSKYQPARPLDYALYLSFFPHLIAGPIVRGNQLIPQLETPRKPANFDIRGGLYDYCTGFLLKVCADRIGAVIDSYRIGGTHESLGAAGHWLVAALYSSQIFGDFAGYTFMAIGVSRLLGYLLPQNFNAPYIAATFQTFWRRWHITLSLFLRDYLYIYSLGGNRVGMFRSYLNVTITMLLGGLWHGASWNFVIWGGIHGSALVVEKAAGMEEPRGLPIQALWWLVVQVTVIIAWVFFRSPTLHDAASFVRCMFAPIHNGLDPQLLYALVFMVPMIGHHVARIPALKTDWMTHWAPQGAIAGIAITLAILFYDYPAAFIYFNF